MAQWRATPRRMRIPSRAGAKASCRGTAAGPRQRIAWPAPDTAEPGRRPEIAPLPGARPPLTVALSRLAPGQVRAGEIAPLLARARALRARMDIPVADRAGRPGDGGPGG